MANWRLLRTLAIVLTGCALAMADAPSTQPAVTEAQRKAVMDILRTLQPAQVRLKEAEEALVKLGDDHLPALRDAAAPPESLVGDDEMKEDRVTTPDGNTVVDMGGRADRVQTFQQHRLAVLQAAIIRLEWKIDPPQVINDWIKSKADKNAEGPQPFEYQPQRIPDPAVARLFPSYLVYAIVIRQYPVARLVKEPLKNGNLFFVKRDGSVLHVTHKDQLEKFFQTRLPRQPEDEGKRAAAAAWMALAQTLHQDGMYRFTIQVGPVEAGDATETVTVKAVTDPRGGNRGQIEARLTFSQGAFQGVTEKANLKPGMRPICQATKLLDADPVVRAMAQQDLLIMGRDGRWYLDEQRATASPQLRAAIDAMWQRILDRDSD